DEAELPGRPTNASAEGASPKRKAKRARGYQRGLFVVTAMVMPQTKQIAPIATAARGRRASFGDMAVAISARMTARGLRRKGPQKSAPMLAAIEITDRKPPTISEGF